MQKEVIYMKIDFRNLAITFLSSMFVGIIIISIGLGAAIHVLHRIATPFVCSDGRMESESEYYSYQPGQSTTTLSWFCVNTETNETQDIHLKAGIVAGVIYGLIIFVISILFQLFGKNLIIINSGRNTKSAPLRPSRFQTQPDQYISRTPEIGKAKRIAQF